MTIDKILEKPLVMLTASDLMSLLDFNKREIIAELGAKREAIYQLPDKCTRTDVKIFWNVSLPTVDKWVREGKLTKIKNGRGTRFDKKQVESLFK